MKHSFLAPAGVWTAIFAWLLVARLPAAELPGVGAAMEKLVAVEEIAGAVTLVATREGLVHLGVTGLADVAARRPMTPDTRFWIASMSKPVTATAVLMLQDDGKLNVADPVTKYLPEFAALKTPAGKLANLTIAQLLTHTSGLGEAPAADAAKAHTLADLVPVWLAQPMQYEPGAKWSYTQSGINAAARVVEVVSGKSFDAFLQERLFGPLGMTRTGFYLTSEERSELATGYARDRATGHLTPADRGAWSGARERPPLGNGGLFSTAPDYGRFCQMLLNGGTWAGRRYLSPTALGLMNTPQTGTLPTGFFQTEAFGRRGTNYGWGIGTCVVKTPHPGVAAMLSPGTFGHGGAWGTQAWVDPVRGVAYVLMVQRSNFANSDASEARRVFQEAAAAALGPK